MSPRQQHGGVFVGGASDAPLQVTDRPRGQSCCLRQFFLSQFRLAAQLRSGACVTVWGSGGVGKTRLVLETAPDVASRFADGIVFVELAELTGPDDVPRAIATAFDVREHAEPALAK